MKKFLILFITIFFVFNFNAAAHSGCGGQGGLGDEGFTVGLELGIDAVTEDDRIPYLTASASFGHSFLENTFDLFTELNYTLGFGDHDHIHDHDDDNDMIHSMYFNFMLGYNLELGVDNESTLSFILQNEFIDFAVSPRIDDSYNVTGVFTPAVLFSHELDRGDIYAQLGVPITYIQPEKDAELEVGLDFTLGWESLFGLELEVTLLTILTPGEDAGLDGVELVIGYDFEPFHFSVETFIPINEFDHRGISILPLIEYSYKNFVFYAGCELDGIGIHEAENGDGHGHSLHITPFIGFKYTF